ncbi:hypothetical protein [Stygiolobus caldivivus]|uniref:Uncharacterized protein n=1 Tax=Stygiolobus caldivivus TaxID=2824673 RepID=A0A8D5U4G2_9CREN|nr:hypothetical protein [Stygiolobus caldivivus]BCU69094.1 hypothetical protein KN1_03910 [Stygiolobus caldivivus]
MEIPWNVISDNNISLSRNEFNETIKNLKPLYEDPREIVDNYRKVKRKIYYRIILILSLFIALVIISYKFYPYLILLSLPITYILGSILTWVLNPRQFAISCILFIVLFFISPNDLIKYSLIASLIPFIWGYFANLKQKIFLGWSSYASNLVASWEDVEYMDSEFTIKLKKGNARLTPYRADIEFTIIMGGFKAMVNSSIFALRKGRIGYIVVVKVNKYHLFNDKFLPITPLMMGKIREFLYTNFNKKEWELG